MFKLFDLRSIRLRILRPAAWEDDFYFWNTETDETTWDIEVGVPRLDGDIPSRQAVACFTWFYTPNYYRVWNASARGPLRGRSIMVQKHFRP